MTAPASPFIEIDYTGRVDGVVFDTTRAADAQRGMRGPFKPAIVKLGSGQLLPGLDAFLTGKAPGSYTITLPPEQAFGKKEATRLKLVPLTSFGKDAQRLVPGMSVTIADNQGVIKSVSGGRVVVDFNHALAGKEVEYTVDHKGPVEDPVKKVAATVRGLLGVELPVAKKDDAVVLTLPQGLPHEALVKQIADLCGVTVTVNEVAIRKDQHVHADGSVHDNSAHKH